MTEGRGYDKESLEAVRGANGVDETNASGAEAGNRADNERFASLPPGQPSTKRLRVAADSSRPSFGVPAVISPPVGVIPIEDRPLWISPPRSREDGEGGRIYLENFSKNYEDAYDLVIAVAEPISRQKLIQEFRIDKYPLYGAASTGRTARELVEKLRQFCKNPLPAEVEEYIFAAVGQYGHVRAVLDQGRQFLECKNSATLETLRRNPVIEAAINKTPEPLKTRNGVRILNGPLLGYDGNDTNSCSAEMARQQLHAVMQQCLEMGYPVVTEYSFADDRTTGELKIQLGRDTRVRSYQEKSLQKMCTGTRAHSGLIVLPCGAGKTLVGIAATCRLQKSTIVLATSNVSVEQWRNEFKHYSDISDKQIFRFTRDSKDDIEEFCKNDAGVLVIATYNMLSHQGQRSEKAERILQRIRQREWGLLVLDEVHVFPAKRVREVVQVVKAHCMLGLTATLVREDQMIDDLNFMIGPKLYEANWNDLVAQGFLANVQCAEVRCTMPELFFREYLRTKSQTFRQYLNAINPAKFMYTEFLIKFHEKRNDKIIVFCDNVEPLKFYARKLHKEKEAILGETKEEERLEIFARFRRCPTAMTIFVSRVGDTSIDIPDANVVIEVSSLFGSRRQEAQRLGRILRPKRRSESGDTHNAFFYALVNSNTKEVCFSARRQSFLVDQGFSYKIVTDLVENESHRAQVEGDLQYQTEEAQKALLEEVRELARMGEDSSGPSVPSAAAAAHSSSATVNRRSGTIGSISTDPTARYSERNVRP